MTRFGNGTDEPMTTARIAGLSDTNDPSGGTNAMSGDPIGEAAADPALVHEHDALAALTDRGMESGPDEQTDDRPAHTGDTVDTGTGTGSVDTGSGSGEHDGDNAQLLGDDELTTVVTRWREIQAEFVDEPRRAVQDADALVADLMQRLAAMFAHEREELEARWSSGSAVDTEDLRQGLQRYRSFFERLLAA